MSSLSRSPRAIGGHAGLAALAIAAALLVGAAPVAAQSPEGSPSEVGGEGLLFIQADTVWGPANLPEEERPRLTCVQNNRFARNEEIVWRVKVFDPLTGGQLDESALESVEVVLPDQDLAMRFGPNPRNEPVDDFWSVSWQIPEDYPTGELPYLIRAVGTDGRVGTYEQFGVSAARLTVTEEVRPVIEEEAA
jgi:hypothetical protein